MKHHSSVNMSQSDRELLPMRSLMEMRLIETVHSKSLNMNILVDQVYKVIIFFLWTLRDRILVKMDVIV